jgi:hypothetical protein
VRPDGRKRRLSVSLSEQVRTQIDKQAKEFALAYQEVVRMRVASPVLSEALHDATDRQRRAEEREKLAEKEMNYYTDSLEPENAEEVREIINTYLTPVLLKEPFADEVVRVVWNDYLPPVEEGEHDGDE